MDHKELLQTRQQQVNPQEQSNVSKDVGVTRMRWLQLANVSILFCHAVTTWQCFSPIAYKIVDNYDVSITLVNILPSMNYIIQILLAIPMSNMIEKKGSSFAVMIASVCNSLGILIKLFINESFWFTFAGQIFNSFTFIIVMVASTKVAMVWFGKEERVIALALIIVA